jgi:hypothetical protein
MSMYVSRAGDNAATRQVFQNFAEIAKFAKVFLRNFQSMQVEQLT